MYGRITHATCHLLSGLRHLCLDESANRTRPITSSKAEHYELEHENLDSTMLRLHGHIERKRCGMGSAMASRDRMFWINFFNPALGDARISFDTRSLFQRMTGLNCSPFGMAMKKTDLTFEQILELDKIYERCVNFYIKTKDHVGLSVAMVSGYPSFGLFMRDRERISPYFSKHPEYSIGFQPKRFTGHSIDSLTGEDSIMRFCLSSEKFMTLEKILHGMNVETKAKYKELISKSNYSIVTNYFLNSIHPDVEHLEKADLAFAKNLGHGFLRSNMRGASIHISAIKAFSEYIIFHDRCGIDNYSDICRWLVTHGENIYSDKNGFSFISELSSRTIDEKSKSCLLGLIDDGADLTFRHEGEEIFQKLKRMKKAFSREEVSSINDSYLATKYFDGYLERAKLFSRSIMLKGDFFDESMLGEIAISHAVSHSIPVQFKTMSKKLGEENFAEKIAEAIYEYAGTGGDVEGLIWKHTTRVVWNAIEGKGSHEMMSITRDVLSMLNKKSIRESGEKSLLFKSRVGAVLSMRMFITKKMLEEEGHKPRVISNEDFHMISHRGRETMSTGYIWGRIPYKEPDQAYLEKEFGIKFKKVKESVRFLDESPSLHG